MTENDYLKRHRRRAWPVSTSCTYASIKHACDFGRCRNRSQYVSCGSADLHSHSYIEPCLYEMRMVPTFFVRWKNNLQVSRQNVHLACHFSRLKFPHKEIASIHIRWWRKVPLACSYRHHLFFYLEFFEASQNHRELWIILGHFLGALFHYTVICGSVSFPLPLKRHFGLIRHTNIHI